MESFQFMVNAMMYIREVFAAIIYRMDHDLDVMIFARIRPGFRKFAVILRGSEILGIT